MSMKQLRAFLGAEEETPPPKTRNQLAGKRTAENLLGPILTEDEMDKAKALAIYYFKKELAPTPLLAMERAKKEIFDSRQVRTVRLSRTRRQNQLNGV